MKNNFKILVLTLAIIVLAGCTLPFQSNNYPTWETNGILESYTLTDGRIVDGWLGAKIGEKVSAKWYDFTVNYVEFLNDYASYTPESDKILVHASITIDNTSDKAIYLFDGDFALVWDLANDERSYAYSMDAFTDSMLTNEMVINKGESKTIDTVYEIDKTVKKPMAIYYNEQYSDGQKGNKYYIYVK